MENKDINKINEIAATYADTKNAINQLQSRLKELEAELKNSGVGQIETDAFKITIYQQPERKTFNFEKFKEMNPDIDYSKTEYYKITKAAMSIRYTKKGA